MQLLLNILENQFVEALILIFTLGGLTVSGVIHIVGRTLAPFVIIGGICVAGYFYRDRLIEFGFWPWAPVPPVPVTPKPKAEKPEPSSAPVAKSDPPKRSSDAETSQHLAPPTYAEIVPEEENRPAPIIRPAPDYMHAVPFYQYPRQYRGHNPYQILNIIRGGHHR